MSLGHVRPPPEEKSRQVRASLTEHVRLRGCPLPQQGTRHPGPQAALLHRSYLWVLVLHPHTPPWDAILPPDTSIQWGTQNQVFVPI